jgi:hypothetical protein
VGEGEGGATTTRTTGTEDTAVVVRTGTVAGEDAILGRLLDVVGVSPVNADLPVDLPPTSGEHPLRALAPVVLLATEAAAAASVRVNCPRDKNCIAWWSSVCLKPRW